MPTPPPQPAVTSAKSGANATASNESQGRAACPMCRTANDPDCVFCENCGYRLTAPSHALDSISSMKAVRPPSTTVKADKSASSKPDSGARQERKDVNVSGPGHGEAPRQPNVGVTTIDDPTTGPQPGGRHSALNMGLTTSVVCEACGSIQPMGGAYCADCGAQLSPGAIARALAEAKQGAKAALHLIVDGGQTGETYKLDRSETVIGRSEGDMTFPHDGYMSGCHARVVQREGRYFLVDAGSRNGTFIRIEKESELEPGDTFLVGKQVLKFDMK